MPRSIPDTADAKAERQHRNDRHSRGATWPTISLNCRPLPICRAPRPSEAAEPNSVRNGQNVDDFSAHAVHGAAPEDRNERLRQQVLSTHPERAACDGKWLSTAYMAHGCSVQWNRTWPWPSRSPQRSARPPWPGRRCSGTAARPRRGRTSGRCPCCTRTSWRSMTWCEPGCSPSLPSGIAPNRPSANHSTKITRRRRTQHEDPAGVLHDPPQRRGRGRGQARSHNSDHGTPGPARLVTLRKITLSRPSSRSRIGRRRRSAS